MAIKLDSDGYLDVSLLTLEEKRQIFDEFGSMLYHADKNWESEYGPFDSLEGLSRDELQEKLANTSDDLIWADVDYFYMYSYISPIDGLTLKVSGWAKIPGRQEYYENEGEVQRYLIASKPRGSEGPDCIYSLAQCACAFCEDGKIDENECEICEGNGIWEIQI